MRSDCVATSAKSDRVPERPISPVQATAPASETNESSWSWWDYIIPRSRPSAPTLTAEIATTEAASKSNFAWDESENYAGLELRVRSPVSAADSVSTVGDSDRRLSVELGPSQMSFSDFVREGYRRETGADEELSQWEKRETTSLRFHPSTDTYEEKERSFHLDRENIEVHGPLEVTLLKDKITMFCSEEATRPLPKAPEQVSSSSASSNGKWWGAANRNTAAQKLSIERSKY